MWWNKSTYEDGFKDGRAAKVDLTLEALQDAAPRSVVLLDNCQITSSTVKGDLVVLGQNNYVQIIKLDTEADEGGLVAFSRPGVLRGGRPYWRRKDNQQGAHGE